MVIRMRVDDIKLHREQPTFATVTLERVRTRRCDGLGTMALGVSTSDLERFIPGSYVDVTIAPAAKVQV